MPRSATPLSLGLISGLSSAAVAQTQTLRPVISKVEIIYSIVTHYNHISDRVAFYNSYGNPKGNLNYTVPHLVYEPSVTLYNPHNVPLTMARSRVKIWNPPVGFAFKKNDVYLRSDFTSGSFHGPGRFQVENELNANATKAFTLSLSSPTATGAPGDPIVLQPGESKTFSTWVEKDWTWGLETASQLTPRSFYDWSSGNDVTNRDNRTSNVLGVEAISTTYPLAVLNDMRAGFQTECLSFFSNQRPTASLYDFENPSMAGSGSVAIKHTDTVSVQAKSMRTMTASGTPDFQVDLLRGQVPTVSSDTVKQFRLNLAGIIQDEQNPIVSRTFRAGSLLQTAGDKTPGGKTPFARFAMVAKPSALRANRFYTTPAIPANDLYELQFGEAADLGQLFAAAPSEASTSAPPEIYGISRTGNTLFIDFSGSSSPYGIKNWFVRGSSSPDGEFTDNLDSATTVIKSMSGSGIYKAIIDITGRGERYFVRIEG